MLTLLFASFEPTALVQLMLALPMRRTSQELSPFSILNLTKF
jgi:hypothetical protein